MEWKHWKYWGKEKKPKNHHQEYGEKNIIRLWETELHQKDNISGTGFASGICIKRELVKNSNLLLASRFLGTLAADSFIVSNECNLLIWFICRK